MVSGHVGYQALYFGLLQAFGIILAILVGTKVGYG